MPNQQTKAPTISPFLLRLALGVTFLWAGTGKLMTQDYSGPMASAIASMNEGTVIEGQWPPAAPETLPDDDSLADEAGELIEETGEIIDEAAGDLAEGVEELTDADLVEDEPTLEAEPSIPAEALTVRARRVMGLAGMLKLSADGNDQRARLIPKALGTDTWAKVLAWAAVATELAAGAAILFGLFSRLAALGIIGTMSVAMWLTQIGPAVRSRVGDNFLGFLPKPMMDAPNWSQYWDTMLWQFALITMACAILFMGAGRLSLDAWVFGAKKSKPAPRKTPYASEREPAPAPSRPRRPDHTDDIKLD